MKLIQMTEFQQGWLKAVLNQHILDTNRSMNSIRVEQSKRSDLTYGQALINFGEIEIKQTREILALL